MRKLRKLLFSERDGLGSPFQKLSFEARVDLLRRYSASEWRLFSCSCYQLTDCISSSVLYLSSIDMVDVTKGCVRLTIDER